MICRKCRSINLNKRTNENGLYVYCQDCQAFQKYINERDWLTICAEKKEAEREVFPISTDIPIIQNPYKVRYKKDDFLKGVSFGKNYELKKKKKKKFKKKLKKQTKPVNKIFSKKMTVKQIQKLKEKVKALKD